jgi:hypothetical protein
VKVFISWSGEMSKELAEAIRDWLPAVLQSVKPFFTPSDIEKGARWSTDIARELEASAIGIFCLTPENLSKPWIMFEAGALSKMVGTARVCPILFNVDSSDLEGPLVQFQACPFTEGEMRKLIKSINLALGDSRLEDGVLTSVFDMWWPKLKERVEAILAKSPKGEDRASRRTDRDILEELLKLTRLNSGRPSIRPRVNPEAVMAALRMAMDVKSKVINEEDETAVITALEELEGPLGYLMRRSDASKDQNERFASLLRDFAPRREEPPSELVAGDP